MDFSSKEPVTIVGPIGPNSTYQEKYNITESAEITDIWISTYVGQEFDLQYTFEISEHENGPWINLLEAMDLDYVGGNGEEIPINIREEIAADSWLRVTVENTDGSNTYTKNAIVTVDYEGMESIIVAIADMVGM